MSVECISRIDIYKRLINEIEAGRPQGCTNKCEYLNSIGVAPPIYYYLKNFIKNGQSALHDRRNVMSDEKLAEMLQGFGITLVEKYYMIENGL